MNEDLFSEQEVLKGTKAFKKRGLNIFSKIKKSGNLCFQM